MRQDSTLEVKRLLNELLNDRYKEIPLEQVNDEEDRELVQAINTLYHQRQASVSVYQDNLKKSEQRLREIIETTPVGICITNAEGVYEYVNKPYCRLYQYEPEELIGRHFTMVVPEHDRVRLTNLHEEFMGRRWELRGEWSVVRKDGEEVNILADAAYIIDVDGRPKKVTFVVDITDRKRAEEQLREMVDRLNHEIEERKRIERIKGEVERLIQHDLRNPLNGILNAAELLLRDNPTESQRELLVMIKESGNKLNTMISSSMDLVRMEEGTYELELQQLNVVDLLRAVHSQLQSLSESRGVHLVYLMDGKPLDWDRDYPVFGEVIYLEELLANLIRNAIEASPRDAVVSVAVTGNGSYLFDIHNQGVVPEPVRDRFFERYATHGKKGGNGLGTYVAALVAKTHGGSVRFTTGQEEGTHVLVDLPKRPAVPTSRFIGVSRRTERSS